MSLQARNIKMLRKNFKIEKGIIREGVFIAFQTYSRNEVE